LKCWPLLNADDDDGNGPTGQVPLMLQVLVRSEEDLETGMLAAVNRSPFFSLSQCSCAAVGTVWPIRNSRIGTGVA
jgi:hypothetical protein